LILKPRGLRLARGESAVLAALLSVLVASCTSAGDPNIAVGMPGYNASSTTLQAADNGHASAGSPAPSAPQMLMTAEGDASLPEQVAFLPSAKPEVAFPVTAPADAAEITATMPPALATAQSAQAAEPAATQAEGRKQTAAPATDNAVYVTAGDPAASDAVEPKKKSFLASFFGASKAKAAPSPIRPTPIIRNDAPKPVITADKPAAKMVTLASATPGDKPLSLASLESGSGVSDNALPGVRQTALFEIKRKSGLDDDSDVDLNEDEGGGGVILASAAGMARLAPNGLLKQTESVDVACLKPSLVRVLKTIEGHYGRKLIVTSGFRDPARNRRARGAKNSLHMFCAAADIQVPGVSKWELASYVRTMPGRGGVGTYCHTESVHVDVGPERDWNWRCRRRGG